MRGRLWIFTAIVTAALLANLVRFSVSVSQTGEDTVRARVAAASTALRAQLDLLDARLAPRAVAEVPDLIEAVRPPADSSQSPQRPDERALRAAGSLLAPEPDLFAVVNAQGAIVSRRAKAAQVLDDPSRLPLAGTASGASPTPAFATFDGAVYRFEAARVPGAAAAAVGGTLVDDRFASLVKSQVDADVTLLQGGKILASSLPQGEERGKLLHWTTSPAPGYGVLQIRLPLIGNQLSGSLPVGALNYAARGALIQLDSGVQAALTVPASPYFAWLGRYQAFYLAALLCLVLFGFAWGLIARPEEVIQRVQLTEPQDEVVSAPRRQPRPSLLETDVGEGREAPARTRDVPWSPGEGPSGEHAIVERGSKPPPAGLELDPPLPTAGGAGMELDPSAAPPAEPEARASGGEAWSFAPTAGQFTKEETAEPEGGGSAAAASAAPDWDLSVPPPPEEPAPVAGAAKDFSFAGLLDDAAAAAPSNGAHEAAAQTPAPREASPAAAEPFPGDEPTRVEPVSAALLDKLR